MAKYRNIALTFWTDSKVVDDFTGEDRFLFLHCLTNPHTNLCGCYEVSFKQIGYETGKSIEDAARIIKRLDTIHNVIRYDSDTKELLVLNWYKYNWSQSEKMDKPLLEEIQNIKCAKFRRYLADKYNARSSVGNPYNVEDSVPVETSTERTGGKKAKPVSHSYGQYGWVKLTDEQFVRLQKDLGDQELQRCITYVDESAQSNGNKNKWKDWNLVIRRCYRDGWGANQQRTSMRGNSTAMSDLKALHNIFDEAGQ